MQRTLLFTGLASFGLSLLMLIPASTLLPLVTRSGAIISGVGGTVWSGSARALTAGPLRFHQLHWQFEPWRLLRGELSAHIEAQLPEGFFAGHVSRSLSGRLAIRDIEAAVPLRALSPGMATMTGNSQLSIRMQQVAWLDGRWKQLSARCSYRTLYCRSLCWRAGHHPAVMYSASTAYRWLPALH